jgi:hypothetical protein
MTRGEMGSHEMYLLVEVSDQTWQAESGRLIHRPPAEDSSLCHGEFWKHRNVYDGNGEYELPITRHYVPQSWRS